MMKELEKIFGGKVLIVLEPTHRWSQFKALELFDEDPKLHSFYAQVVIATTLLEAVNKARQAAAKDGRIKLILYERCLHTAKEVFNSVAYDNNNLTSDQVEILSLDFDQKCGQFGLKYDALFFLKIKPSVAFNRAVLRDASYEKSNTLDYFVKISQKYDKKLEVLKAACSGKCFILDANLSILKLAGQASKILIENFALDL